MHRTRASYGRTRSKLAVDELSCCLLAVPYRTSLAGTAEERNPGILESWFLYFQVFGVPHYWDRRSPHHVVWPASPADAIAVAADGAGNIWSNCSAKSNDFGSGLSDEPDERDVICPQSLYTAKGLWFCCIQVVQTRTTQDCVVERCTLSL